MKIEDFGNLFHVDYWRIIKEVKKKQNDKCHKNIIAKKLDISYVQCFILLKKLKEMKVITEEKDGRKCFIKLTDIGEQLYKIIDVVRKIE